MEHRPCQTKYTAESAFSSDGDVDSFLDLYSVFPCCSNKQLIKSILKRAVRYKSLSRARSDFKPSILSISRSNTIDKKELLKKLHQGTIYHFLESSKTLDSCCRIKYSDTHRWDGFIPNQSTFKDVASLVTADNNAEGIIVCCYDQYRTDMGLGDDLLKSKAKEAKNKLKDADVAVGIECKTTDILSFGGFYSPLHLDNGGSNRRHLLTGAQDGSVKLIIISNSMAKNKTSEIQDGLNDIWKRGNSAGIEDELSWINNNHSRFDFVLQRVGEEIEHCGAFYHSFITFVNPISNPQLVCLSIGYMILSARALTQYMNNAPVEEIGFTNTKGEIIPIMKKRVTEEDSANATAAKKKKIKKTAAKLATFENVTAAQFTTTPATLFKAAKILRVKFKDRGVKAAETKREKK
jgi:hypothetical protein